MDLILKLLLVAWIVWLVCWPIILPMLVIWAIGTLLQGLFNK